MHSVNAAQRLLNGFLRAALNISTRRLPGAAAAETGTRTRLSAAHKRALCEYTATPARVNTEILRTHTHTLTPSAFVSALT